MKRPPLRPTPQEAMAAVDLRRAPARMVLASAGLLASAYLTVLHYTGAAPVSCPEGGFVNCQAVLQSSAAQVWGVPVAALGLVYFAVALALAFFRRRPVAPMWEGIAHGWAIGGALVVLALVHTELYTLGRLCLWCSFTHALALALLGLEMWPGAARLPQVAGARR